MVALTFLNAGINSVTFKAVLMVRFYFSLVVVFKIKLQLAVETHCDIINTEPILPMLILIIIIGFDV